MVVQLELDLAIVALGAALWDANATSRGASDSDISVVELGMKLHRMVDGLVTGGRFYKGPQNVGTHLGNLWSGSGQLLAQSTFNNERVLAGSSSPLQHRLRLRPIQCDWSPITPRLGSTQSMRVPKQATAAKVLLEP